MIPYGRQSIGEAEIAAVEAVLRSDFLTQGPEGPAFEASLRAACDAPHALAMNSATSALHVACLALGLKPGGRLWTSPNSFVASANVGLLCGADVDFVDIDAGTFNMSPDALAEKLAAAEAAGALPDIVMPVHFGGEPCDMGAIAALAARYGFRTIADASHAVGARLGNAAVGACRDCDVSVFSFHPVKIVTTAEGGAATTRDEGLAERMGLYRSHGVTREARLMEGASHGPWYYEQVDLGLNYRMTDMQAALGRVQMGRLEAFVAAREAIAARYDAMLADLPVLTQGRAPANRSALHLFPVTVEIGAGLEARMAARRTVFEAMRGAGIGVNVHYIPIHTQPHYRRLGFGWGDFPAAEHYYAGAISLPLFPDLTEAMQDKVVAALKAGLKEAGKAA